VRACRDRLQDGADLRLYSSALAAEDLDDVRAALGYERINLEAASYGTRVALLYLRQHSARVRAAVLRSVSPPWVKQPLHFAEDAQAAFDSLVDACRVDSACATEFPDFEEEFVSVLARLDDGGVDVERPAADGAAPTTIRVTRGAFAEKVRIMLYAPELSSFLPLLVHRAASGDFGPFVELAEEIGQQIARVGANGMYLSVTCAEDVARITPEEAANPWPGTFLADWRVRQQRAACALWPRADLPADFADPIRSDAPVLLVSSTIDPITPPRWADEVAIGLANARHVRVPNASHSPSGECVMGIVHEFLRTASHEGLDLDCIEEIRRPPFQVELPD
jgi:pimeloyl-ACP methyl ester carboxylesterase